MTHIEKYVGYDIEERYHPAYAYALMESQVLKNMRLNGLYGIKSCCPNPSWRQSTFESFKDGDEIRNTENSLSYPLDAVAAFIQWFFPSAGRTVLEPNINSHDLIGDAVKCLTVNKKEGLERLANILKIFNTLTINEDALENPNIFFSDYLNEPNLEKLRKKIFLQIMVHAIKIIKNKENAIYFDYILEYVFVSFLTQIVEEKKDLLYIFEKAEIAAKDKPYFILDDLTREEYYQFKMYPLSLDDIVIGLEYYKKYEQTLPTFIRYEHSSVDIDGEHIKFPDCGETAFLNFCLCFLWDDHKINSHRWAGLKERYPTFAPFVAFFEENTTLDQIRKNRNQWATLISFKEWQSIKPTYNRKNKAELIGGTQSFLNLMSILFKEDEIMQKAFKNEKLCTPDDQNLAKEKWIRLLSLLNQESNIQFKDMNFTCKNDMNLIFVKNEESFRYNLTRGHFSLVLIDKKYPKSFLNEHCLNHIILCLFSNQFDYHKTCQDIEYFWYNIGTYSYQSEGIVKKIKHSDLLTIMMRRFSGNHFGVMDDTWQILYELKILLSGLYPELSFYEQFIEFFTIPICQAYFFKFFALNCLSVITNTEETLNTSFIKLLSDSSERTRSFRNQARRFFKELAESHHPQRYKVLAYYDQEKYFRYVFKRSEHADYKLLFEDKMHESHPISFALRAGAEKVLKIYAPLKFWKIYNNSPLCDRTHILQCLSIQNVLHYLIENYPDVLLFSEDIEKNIRKILSYFASCEGFESIWHFYKKQKPLSFTDEWLIAPYYDDVVQEDYTFEDGKTNIFYAAFENVDSSNFNSFFAFIKKYGKPKCIHKKLLLDFVTKYFDFTWFTNKNETLLILLDYIDTIDDEILNCLKNTVEPDLYLLCINLRK